MEELESEAKKVMGSSAPLRSSLVMEVENQIRSHDNAANIIAAICNVLQGIVYDDDSQIKEIHYIQNRDGEYLVRVYPQYQTCSEIWRAL